METLEKEQNISTNILLGVECINERLGKCGLLSLKHLILICILIEEYKILKAIL